MKAIESWVGDNRLAALFPAFLLEVISRPWSGGPVEWEGEVVTVGDLLRHGIAGATTGMRQEDITRLMSRLNKEVLAFIAAHRRRTGTEVLFIAFNIYQCMLDDGIVPPPEGQLLAGVDALLSMGDSITSGNPDRYSKVARRYVAMLINSGRLNFSP